MARKERVELLGTKVLKDYLEEQAWMENVDRKEILDSLDHLAMMEE